jgi:uncharacterized protein YndB with AHSA1/START domain
VSIRATRISLHLDAPRETTSSALIDSEAIAAWMVPTGMTSRIHTFEGREGGAFRIPLTYDESTGTGKTLEHTNTYHGRFVTVVPNELIEQVVEFETDDPEMQEEMTIRFLLSDSDGGTALDAAHDDLPPGLSAEMNDIGWRSSLAKLATLVETRPAATPQSAG